MLRFIQERNDTLILRLEGDRDTIVVRDADKGVVANLEFLDDAFLG